jgi:DNA polymerase-3 subunit epsilon
MILNIERPIIFFDLETTGTNSVEDRIVEMATVKIWPDGKTEQKCRRFNPGIPIPKEATAVHGITNDDVKSEPHFYQMARGPKGIAAYFKNCDLGGYNIINFDIPMLAEELKRAGEKLDQTNISIVDAYKLFVTKEPRTLSGALKFYCNSEHTQAHGALGDVLATVKVLEAQLERYSDVPTSPHELDLFVRPPDYVDRQGKLKWVDGLVAVNFGRHRGTTLKHLAATEPDYINWMIDNKIAEDASSFLHDALLGHFATRDEIDSR